MIRLYLIYILSFIPICLFAQKDAKAGDVLMKAEKSIAEGGIIHARFEGSLEGEIFLKGEKFHLKGNGIQSWYDGKTQWSYSEDTQEVNISTPTPDELQSVNPYALMQTYKEGYNYQYKGMSNIGGRNLHQVVLLPEKSTDITSITLYLTKEHLPAAILIQHSNQTETLINIVSCRLHQQVDESIFTFDKKEYPEAEIIDLR